MEEHLERNLEPGEVVHHIDANERNNEISNLYLCSNGTHKKAHISLKRVVTELVGNGTIVFDHIKGDYRICEKSQ